MALAQRLVASACGVSALDRSPRQTRKVYGPAERAELFSLRSGSRIASDSQGEESRTNVASFSWRGAEWESRRRVAVQFTARAYKVEMIHEGKSYMLEVSEGETILEVALESGVEVPHDCKLGVCMTCPAKVEKGSLDQSEGMLSDDVIDRGYALMCVARPQTDCTIRTIPEEELLSLQLATANDA